MREDDGSAIRAFTAGLLRGVGAFLALGGLVVAGVTLGGLVLFVVDREAFNPQLEVWVILLGVPLAAALLLAGSALRAAARYDP